MRAGVVLDQDAEEALDGSKDGAVDHDGLAAAAVRVHVLHVEALRQIEVELHCAALPLPPNRIPHLRIRPSQRPLNAVLRSQSQHFWIREEIFLDGERCVSSCSGARHAASVASVAPPTSDLLR